MMIKNSKIYICDYNINNFLKLGKRARLFKDSFTVREKLICKSKVFDIRK